jgi:hypothetical protein
MVRRRDPRLPVEAASPSREGDQSIVKYFYMFSSIDGALGCGEAKKVNYLPKKWSTEVA